MLQRIWAFYLKNHMLKYFVTMKMGFFIWWNKHANMNDFEWIPVTMPRYVLYIKDCQKKYLLWKYLNFYMYNVLVVMSYDFRITYKYENIVIFLDNDIKNQWSIAI